VHLTIACGILSILTACGGPLSTLDPAGPVAGSVARLWWVMLVGAGLLLALVLVLLALAFIRPGAGSNMPASVWIVGGGLVLPAAILTPLMIYALVGGERLIQARAAAATEVDVLARQWEWQFTYRAAGGGLRRSINVLHIPAGESVRLNITSADVIHAFWIPRLAGKIDAIPGHITVLRLMADVPGRYRGLCAEFCGTAHWEMQMHVEAHAPGELEKIIEELPSAEAPARAGTGAPQ
jgi:cytochrome c oxidase subunit 2